MCPRIYCTFKSASVRSCFLSRGRASKSSSFTNKEMEVRGNWGLDKPQMKVMVKTGWDILLDPPDQCCPIDQPLFPHEPRHHGNVSGLSSSLAACLVPVLPSLEAPVPKQVKSSHPSLSPSKEILETNPPHLDKLAPATKSVPERFFVDLQRIQEAFGSPLPSQRCLIPFRSPLGSRSYI